MSSNCKFSAVNTCQKLRQLAADKVIALIKGGHFYWTTLKDAAAFIAQP